MRSQLDAQGVPRQPEIVTSLRRVLYACFAFICLFFVLWYVLYTAAHSELWDFGVFYGSAQAALRGQDIYQTYGQYHLPYWYFPWVAWFFIPLAILPYGVAKVVFLSLTFLAAGLLVFVAGPRLAPGLSVATRVLIASMSLLACWLLFRVGQADFILVAVAVGIIFMIDARMSVLAGALFPVLLFKPHLMLVFIPFTIIRGGRKYLLSAAISVMLLAAAGLVLSPRWPLQMVSMLQHSGQRVDNAWGFMTLPELIGRQENWSGTANLPLTFAVFAVVALAAWRNRHLSTVPLLSFALAASLLCAPRAYSYNLPFLLPALMWLSPASVVLTSLLWLTVGATAFTTQFSTGSYVIVLATFALAVLKAERLRRAAPQAAPS